MLISHCKFICIITLGLFSAILFSNIVYAANQESKFRQYQLKYGIKVLVPTSWRIVSNEIMDLVDTNTEIMTGVNQGNNEILITANSNIRNTLYPIATLRISIRHGKEAFSQEEIASLSNKELTEISNLQIQASEDLYRKTGKHATISNFNTSVTKIDGILGLENFSLEIERNVKTNYRLIMIHHPKGLGLIKIHTSFEANNNIAKNIVQHIINSIRLEK